MTQLETFAEVLRATCKILTAASACYLHRLEKGLLRAAANLQTGLGSPHGRCEARFRQERCVRGDHPEAPATTNEGGASALDQQQPSHSQILLHIFDNCRKYQDHYIVIRHPTRPTEQSCVRVQPPQHSSVTMHLALAHGIHRMPCRLCSCRETNKYICIADGF